MHHRKSVCVLYGGYKVLSFLQQPPKKDGTIDIFATVTNDIKNNDCNNQPIEEYIVVIMYLIPLVQMLVSDIRKIIYTLRVHGFAKYLSPGKDSCQE